MEIKENDNDMKDMQEEKNRGLLVGTKRQRRICYH